MRLVKFILVVFICQVSSILHAEICADNVRGVIIQSYLKIFDGMFSKRSATAYRGAYSILEDTTEINTFITLLNECAIIDTPPLRSMADGNTFGVSKSSGWIFEEYNWRREPKILITIYFNNGRLPQILWVSYEDIETNGKLYHYSEKLNDYLYNLHYEDEDNMDDVSQQVAIWEQTKPRMNGIEAIKLYTQEPADTKSMSRSEFVRYILNSDIINNKNVMTLFLDPSETTTIIENLSKFIISDVLDYSSSESGAVYKLSKNKTIEWITKSSPVTGLIVISYKNDMNPELIWITPTGIERDNYKLIPEKSDVNIIDLLISTH